MESIAMPKVLITGAGGQVGYKLTALAGKSGFSVFAAGHADLDITDRSQVNSAVARELPDVIINAAAYTAVDRAAVSTLTERRKPVTTASTVL